MSFPPLALTFTSTCSSICISVPPIVLHCPFLLATLKRAPPPPIHLHQLLVYCYCIAIPLLLPCHSIAIPLPFHCSTLHIPLSLDSVYRYTAPSLTFIPSSHSASLQVEGLNIFKKSNVPILLAFIHQREVVLCIYGLPSPDDVNCVITNWIHCFRRRSALFDLAGQTSRSVDTIVSPLTILPITGSSCPNHLAI